MILYYVNTTEWKTEKLQKKEVLLKARCVCLCAYPCLWSVWVYVSVRLFVCVGRSFSRAPIGKCVPLRGCRRLMFLRPNGQVRRRECTPRCACAEKPANGNAGRTGVETQPKGLPPEQGRLNRGTERDRETTSTNKKRHGEDTHPQILPFRGVFSHWQSANLYTGRF